MRYAFLYILNCCSPIAGQLYAQLPHYFTQENKAYDPEFDSNIHTMLLFRKEENREKHLLTFTLRREFRDGHYREYEVGGYVWEDSCLHLWTYWNFEGDDNLAPKGARHMVYRVRTNGKLYLEDAVIYLEIGLKSEGAMFLHEEATSPEERSIFRSYVAQIQKTHHARFVFGQESNSLLADTRKKLASQIAAVKGK